VDSLIKHITDEWSVVGAAPLTFIVLAILMLGATFLVLSWFYSGRLENLEGRIKMRDDQITEYKEKLSGASPDEAKARIEALETKIAVLMPRQLSATARTQLAAVASRAPATLRILHDGAIHDANRYAADLGDAFGKGSWNVSYGMVIGIGQPIPSGVGLTVNDVANLTASQVALADALRASDVPFDFLMRGRPMAGVDAELTITAKVT
jgi:hypothetical protein